MEGNGGRRAIVAGRLLWKLQQLRIQAHRLLPNVQRMDCNGIHHKGHILLKLWMAFHHLKLLNDGLRDLRSVGQDDVAPLAALVPSPPESSGSLIRCKRSEGEYGDECVQVV